VNINTKILIRKKHNCNKTPEKKRKVSQKGRVLKHHFSRKRNIIVRWSEESGTEIVHTDSDDNDEEFLDKMVKAKCPENFEDLE
jgi:hypothetical protein